jgi:hypothetical protein
MNLNIERIAITLQGISPDLGDRVTDLLGGALTRRLSDLKLRTAGSSLGASIAHADLAAIDAPAGLDAHALTDLIAARLVDWVQCQHGANTTPAPPPTATSTTQEGH